MAWENANVDILDHTPAQVRVAARFYFRPRTPMSYNNEGFRTAGTRHSRAYCSMPIALVFPSGPLLTAATTRYSDGNCSSRNTSIGDTADFLQQLPFRDIYHDTYWPEGDEREVVKNRCQAEVLVSSPLRIGDHRFLVCTRSVAEKETLLSLLTPDAIERYREKVFVPSKRRLFQKRWSYIESVSAVEDRLTIRFNESTLDRSDFQIRIAFFRLDGTPLMMKEGQRPVVEPLTMDLTNLRLEGQSFRLRIELEGDLAYESILDPRPQFLFEQRD